MTYAVDVFSLRQSGTLSSFLLFVFSLCEPKNEQQMKLVFLIGIEMAKNDEGIEVRLCNAGFPTPIPAPKALGNDHKPAPVGVLSLPGLFDIGEGHWLGIDV
jgi:hypothetical protein